MKKETIVTEEEAPDSSSGISCLEDPADEEPPSSSIEHFFLTPPDISPPKPRHSRLSLCNSPRAHLFRMRFFPGVTKEQWNDWHWQLANRITNLEGLSRIIHLTVDECAALNQPEGNIPFGITPYYASLLDANDPSQSIRRSVVPTTAEFSLSTGEAADPLDEDSDSPVPGLVHRYPDRVLFLVTGHCSVYCRYCTRSRMVGHEDKQHFNKTQCEQAIEYIERTPTVRDVLLSGGDPLTMSDSRLDWILTRLRRIPHVEIIRIGTKTPVVLPQRITPSLTRMLRKYQPLFISIHLTHPDELTPETNQACCRLADAGIPLGSQTVLLAGVNDNIETMKQLFHGLLKIRVKPYYLYQCDPILGSAHFRTPVRKGLEIMEGLRGHTSGYAVPTYVIDAPGGGGKIPLLPTYLIGQDIEGLVLRNYEGNTYYYPDKTFYESVPDKQQNEQICL